MSYEKYSPLNIRSSRLLLDRLLYNRCGGSNCIIQLKIVLVVDLALLKETLKLNNQSGLEQWHCSMVSRFFELALPK